MGLHEAVLYVCLTAGGICYPGYSGILVERISGDNGGDCLWKAEATVKGWREEQRIGYVYLVAWDRVCRPFLSVSETSIGETE